MTAEVQLKRKDSTVNLQVHPMFNQAAPILKTAWIMHGASPTVTSGADGTHSANSAHYKGQALDLRIFNLPFKSLGLLQFCNRLADALVEVCGPYFFVVLESDHIHLELVEPGQVPNIKGYKPGLHFYEKASA
jgi:hypothetical protein